MWRSLSHTLRFHPVGCRAESDPLLFIAGNDFCVHFLASGLLELKVEALDTTLNPF